jgi:hypothetical protein
VLKSPLRLLRCLNAIHTPPGANDALHLRCSPGECDVKEPSFILRCRYSRQRAHFGVRHFTALHRSADARQRRQREGDPYLLASGPEIDAGAPVQPVRAGEAAVVPTGAVVELTKHDEQFIGGRVQPRGKRGDGIAELSDVTITLGGGRHQMITSGPSSDER